MLAGLEEVAAGAGLGGGGCCVVNFSCFLLGDALEI